MKDKEQIFFTKVAEFININLNDRKQLLNKVAEYQTKKAAYEAKLAFYDEAISKIANVLLEEDFLTGSRECETFMKKAKEDPSFLASSIKKVCESAGISVMGKTARVAVKNTLEIDDPIMRRAFGYSSSGSVLVDEP